MNHIIWSDLELSLKDFEYRYEYQLPAIVHVTQGYCGYGEDLFTYSADETYWVDKLACQRRIVAKDEKGTLYSIPVSYPIKFKVLSKTSWKDLAKKAHFLDEILSRCDVDEHLLIAPEDHDSLKFWQGADKRSSIKFFKLEIISVYEDKCLIVNSIIDGHVYDGMIIPLFVNIKIKVAEGLKNGGPQEFDQMKKTFKRTVGERNHNVRGNKEIMIFDNDVTEYGVYDYLEPSTYVSCNQARTVRKHVDLYEAPSKRKSDATTYTTLNKAAEINESIYCEAIVDKKPEGDKSKLKAVTAEFEKLNRTRGSSHGINPPTPHEFQSVRLRPPPAVPPKPRAETTRVRMPDPHMSTNQIYQDTADDDPGVASEPTDDSMKKKTSIYTSMKDVPKVFRNLTKMEVADCLRVMKMEQHAEKFLENDVDGALLLDLDEDILTKDFGLSRFEGKKLLRFARKGWRPE